MAESDLLWRFLQAVPKAIPGAHAERRNIIRGARVGRSEARVSNGIPGQADAFVILTGSRHVECETKAAGAGHDPDLGCTCETCGAQRRWRARCAKLGIPYLKLRALEGESESQTVERWIGEVRIA
jgi:hypothetical protein